MVWLIDDLAEAALGPWGLAVALGMGVVAATRRTGNSAAVAGSDGPVIDVVPVSGASIVATSTGAVAAVPATVAAAAGRVKSQVRQAVSGAEEYWRDLYAEAHHEWEASRATGPVTITIDPTADPAAASAESAPVSKRVRGANGRYVKETV